MNHASRNPRVPALQPGSKTGSNDPGVRVTHYIVSRCVSTPFRLQTIANLKEGDQWQMWEFIRVE